jgi:hypothetical protein
MIGSIYFKSPRGDGVYDSKNGDGSRLERRSPFSRCFGSVCTGFILAKSDVITSFLLRFEYRRGP